MRNRVIAIILIVCCAIIPVMTSLINTSISDEEYLEQQISNALSDIDVVSLSISKQTDSKEVTGMIQQDFNNDIVILDYDVEYFEKTSDGLWDYYYVDENGDIILNRGLESPVVYWTNVTVDTIFTYSIDNYELYGSTMTLDDTECYVFYVYLTYEDTGISVRDEIYIAKDTFLPFARFFMYDVDDIEEYSMTQYYYNFDIDKLEIPDYVRENAKEDV